MTQQLRHPFVEIGRPICLPPRPREWRVVKSYLQHRIAHRSDGRADERGADAGTGGNRVRSTHTALGALPALAHQRADDRRSEPDPRRSPGVVERCSQSSTQQRSSAPDRSISPPTHTRPPLSALAVSATFSPPTARRTKNQPARRERLNGTKRERRSRGNPRTKPRKETTSLQRVSVHDASLTGTARATKSRKGRGNRAKRNASTAQRQHRDAACKALRPRASSKGAPRAAR